MSTPPSPPDAAPRAPLTARRSGGRYLRHTADVEGPFVVFLIGAYVIKWWRLDAIARVGRAMNAMMQELEAHPELGYLGQEQWPGLRPSIQVQYWRSRDALMAYARDPDAAHLPAWREFNRVIAATTAVGIWHETYCVEPGQWECVYGNMPPFGLARATRRIEVSGRRGTARGRLGDSDGTDAPSGTEV